MNSTQPHASADSERRHFRKHLFQVLLLEVVTLLVLWWLQTRYGAA